MTQPCLSECEAPSTCKKKIKGIKKEEQRNEKMTVDASYIYELNIYLSLTKRKIKHAYYG
jgi:hypothetical protein